MPLSRSPGPNGRTLTTSFIVRERHLPRKFLEAILCELKVAGIVASRKGKNGGYTLTKDPNDISIYQVINALEPDNRFACIHADKGRLCKSCSSLHRCMIDLVMHSIRDHVIDWLSTHTIADIANDNGELDLEARFIDSKLRSVAHSTAGSLLR